MRARRDDTILKQERDCDREKRLLTMIHIDIVVLALAQICKVVILIQRVSLLGIPAGALLPLLLLWRLLILVVAAC